MTATPALHRSLLFWAGILVMVFIGWAWWASVQATSYLEAGRWTVRNAMSGVVLQKLTPQYNPFLGFPPPTTGMEVHCELQEPCQYEFPRERFPAPWWIHGDGREAWVGAEWLVYLAKLREPSSQMDYLGRDLSYQPVDDWILFIPHWLVMLLTAGIWTGMLVWWRRRMRRKMEVNP